MHLLNSFKNPSSEFSKKDSNRVSNIGTQMIPPLGSPIILAGVDWAANKDTLLLVLSTTCGACTQSASFYQKIIQQLERKGGTAIVAGFSQSVDEGEKYLRSMDVPVRTVVQIEPRTIGVRGTPSLIHVDSNGSVKNAWFGRLSPETELKVFKEFGI